MPQTLDLAELGQLMKHEDAVGESGHKQFRLRMEASTRYVGIVLHKIVSLLYAPCHVLVSLLGIFGRVEPQHVLPNE